MVISDFEMGSSDLMMSNPAFPTKWGRVQLCCWFCYGALLYYWK